MTTAAPNPSKTRVGSPSALERDESALTRLTTLTQLVEGAWALAVSEDAYRREQVTDQLQASLGELPVRTVSLAATPTDLLRTLDDISEATDHPAPVVVFNDVGRADTDIFDYLDLQRDKLARLPHRLLFWVTEADAREFVQHAPNFASRLSGVFRFQGDTSLLAQAVGEAVTQPGVTTPRT